MYQPALHAIDPHPLGGYIAQEPGEEIVLLSAPILCQKVIGVVGFARNHDQHNQSGLRFCLIDNGIRQRWLVKVLIFKNQETSGTADETEITLPNVVAPDVLRSRSDRDSSQHLQLLYVLFGGTVGAVRRKHRQW